MTSAELIRAVGEALYGSRYDTDLAAALRISRRTVLRWKSGDTEPSAGHWRDVLALVMSRRQQLETLAGWLWREDLGVGDDGRRAR